MMSRILYTLKGTKIFSKNRVEALNQLQKNMKNSLIYFDEIIFESGVHTVSYGDTGSAEISGPYNDKEFYSRLKKSYSIDSEEKKPFVMTATPKGSDKSFPIINTEAFSFCSSFEGELEILLENFSGKELDFVKIAYIDRIKFEPLVSQNEEYIRSQMTLSEYPFSSIP